MSGSNIAAANFVLFFTEALRRFMGATPNETFEFNQPTLPPAPPVAQEEEVAVNAPPVQWADEEEEEDEEAGVDAIDLDDGDEDEDESEAEDGEVGFVWSELRRNSTMIMDLYEDEYVPGPVNDEGVAFVDNTNNEQTQPLPIAEIINDNQYVKVGNIFLRAGSRKRDRATFEEDDEFVSSSQTSDRDARPVKRYRRTIRLAKEKRLCTQHAQIEDSIYESLEDDLERLQSQQEPSDIRLSFLGKDGLDDAPTPPGSPVAQMEPDFE